ncbi:MULTISPECIES: NAD kinase [Kocuria]|uniref:NAD kinase n=1 Tax=Kocuria TaxID=57493 RepID=UPI00203BEA3A|nr:MULTISPECIES: NAD kinase [Kocuria]MCM3689542.1 NAD kinase [Kocuria rosea]HST71624.1 NAD kinase [Kocuria rosea]
MSRKILVMAHTGRREAKDAARESCLQLHEAGLVPVISRTDLEALLDDAEPLAPVEIIEEDVSLREIELVMVLGGDGSILRAAELVRSVDTPLLGVNLGHVGFLAESERSDLASTVEAIVDGRYTVEQRMAIDITVWQDEKKVLHTWALNEASVEKGNREKMIEVVIEVDRRPLSTFGCDGVVLATPTGSTAYAFSAGGPVVWPEVEALLMVPLSAHALFSRPLVISPNSMMAVEVLTRTDTRGVLWCDGRRTTELPPGSRIEVVRSPKAVNLARMHRTPFSERLVKKFELPTTGWRGPVPPHEVPALPAAPRRAARGEPHPGTVPAALTRSSVGREMPHGPDAETFEARDQTAEAD